MNKIPLFYLDKAWSLLYYCLIAFLRVSYLPAGRQVAAKRMGTMYTIYALLSLKKKVLYIGLTRDIKKRLFQHNSGNSNWSKRYRPWRLIYTEIAQDRGKARIREKWLKSGCGREYIRKSAGIV